MKKSSLSAKLLVLALIAAMVLPGEAIYSNFLCVKTVAASDGMYHTTIDSAAKDAREKIKNRNTTIKILYKCKQTDTVSLAKKIMDQAMAHTGKPDEGDYLRFQYESWNCDTTWSWQGDDPGVWYISITYHMQYYTNLSQEQEMNSLTRSLLSRLSLSGKSDYQKVKAIYDEVTALVRYDTANLNNSGNKLKYTAYAALKNHLAVCQGFGTLIYRLMLEAGVDCRVIGGTGKSDISSGNHVWNIVKLGNQYYNLDATWDAVRVQSGRDKAFFLCGAGEALFPGHAADGNLHPYTFWQTYSLSNTNYSSSGQITPVPSVPGSLTLNRTKATLYAGSKVKNAYRTMTLKPTLKGISGAVQYRSSNPKVAKISAKKENGVFKVIVTAEAKGKAKVTATVVSGGKTYSASCQITVKNPTLSVSKNKLTVKVGKTQKIKAVATPSNTITYKSANKAVATVSGKGVVKGQKPGTTTITVTSNGKTKKVRVTVSK